MLKNRTPALGFIFFTLVLDITGLGIIIPVLPALITKLTGDTVSEAAQLGGFLLFSFSIMQFLFAPLMGNLSDRYGRRPILLASLFGFTIDYILMAVAPNVGWLFAGRILAGLFGASITTGMSYIADVSPPEKRSQNFGMVGAAFGIGFVAGPVLGGILGEFGPRVPFYAAAGLTFINWIYGYYILPESLPPEKRRHFNWKRANPLGSLKHLRKYPLLGGLVFALFFVYIASHAVQSNWAFFTIHRFKWSESMVGYSLGTAGVLVGLVQGLLIRVVNPRLGPKKSVYTGMALYFTGLMLFAFANKGWMMFVFLVPYCLGGITGPAVQGIMSNQVPDNEQGELQGAFASMVSVSSIIGPPLMTGIFAYATSHRSVVYFPGASFFVGALLTLVSLSLALWFLRKHK